MNQIGITGVYDAARRPHPDRHKLLANYQTALRSIAVPHDNDNPATVKTVEFRAPTTATASGPPRRATSTSRPQRRAADAVDDGATVGEDARGRDRRAGQRPRQRWRSDVGRVGDPAGERCRGDHRRRYRPYLRAGPELLQRPARHAPATRSPTRSTAARPRRSRSRSPASTTRRPRSTTARPWRGLGRERDRRAGQRHRQRRRADVDRVGVPSRERHRGHHRRRQPASPTSPTRTTATTRPARPRTPSATRSTAATRRPSRSRSPASTTRRPRSTTAPPSARTAPRARSTCSPTTPTTTADRRRSRRRRIPRTAPWC